MDYVQKLINLRQDRDKTQKQIGEVLNKSQQGYSHLENRNAEFKIEDIITLCKYYNISPEYILGFTDEPKPLPKK